MDLSCTAMLRKQDGLYVEVLLVAARESCPWSPLFGAPPELNALQHARKTQNFVTTFHQAVLITLQVDMLCANACIINHFVRLAVRCLAAVLREGGEALKRREDSKLGWVKREQRLRRKNLPASSI